MKRVLLVLCVLFSLSVSSALADNGNSKPVEMHKGEAKDPNKVRPRDLIQVPIACFYSDGSLFFTFMEDLGELEISVTNLNTGVEIIDEIDSFCGNALLEVSESSGEYQIEITTETDDSYYGEYTL